MHHKTVLALKSGLHKHCIIKWSCITTLSWLMMTMTNRMCYIILLCPKNPRCIIHYTAQSQNGIPDIVQSNWNLGHLMDFHEIFWSHFFMRYHSIGSWHGHVNVDTWTWTRGRGRGHGHVDMDSLNRNIDIDTWTWTHRQEYMNTE
jgi:hypothetical protein